MLAARDQENLTHRHRTAAAAKPLNQQSSRLAPKTPGPASRTTRVQLNDENGPEPVGKSTKKGPGKGGEDGDGAKGKEVQKTPFVTPSGPRNRAVLGTKTTNAKARAFQTPAEPLTRQKPVDGTSSMYGSIRRSKIKIATPTRTVEEIAAKVLEEDNVPDIEYMPPPEIPMPDHDTDVWPHDLDMSVVSPENLEKLRQLNLIDPRGPDGLRLSERTKIEHQKALEKECLQIGIEAWDSLPDIDDPLTGKPMANPFRDAVPAEQEKGKAKTERSQPGTLKTKSAAKALSQKPANARAAPTTTAGNKAKPMLKSKLLPSSKQISSGPPQKNTRITGKHTLGYNLGRTASTNLASHRPTILTARTGSAASGRRHQPNKENDEVVMPKKRMSAERNWALEFPEDEEMQALMAELEKSSQVIPGADEDFVFTL